MDTWNGAAWNEIAWNGEVVFTPATALEAICIELAADWEIVINLSIADCDPQ